MRIWLAAVGPIVPPKIAHAPLEVLTTGPAFTLSNPANIDSPGTKVTTGGTPGPGIKPSAVVKGIPACALLF